MTTKRKTRTDKGKPRAVKTAKPAPDPTVLWAVHWGTNVRYVPARSRDAARRYWARHHPALLAKLGIPNVAILSDAVLDRDLRSLDGDVVVRLANADEVADWNASHQRNVEVIPGKVETSA